MVSFRLEASPLSDARTAAEAEVPWTLTRSAVADDDNNDEASFMGAARLVLFIPLILFIGLTTPSVRCHK